MVAITTLLKSVTLGRFIVYLAAAVNIALAVLVAVTAAHASYGKLQAQEDFEVFMLIITISGPIAFICLITLMVGVLLNIRTISFSAQLFKSPVAVLGVLNCVAPFALAFALMALVGD